MRIRTVLLAIFLSIAATSCGQEGKIRSEMVAGCMSAGASEAVCKCSFEKLKDKIGLDALVTMKEENIVPPGFAEASVAAVSECRAGKVSSESSALIGIGDGAGPPSGMAVDYEDKTVEPEGEERTELDRVARKTTPTGGHREPIRAVLFGEVIPNDAAGLPVINMSDFGAAGTGYSDAVLVVAQQIGDSKERWKFCEREGKALRNWPDWEEVLDACRSGSTPKAAPPTFSQDDLKECLVQGSCGDSWGRQYAALESLLNEKKDWSINDILQISSEAVSQSFPDTENGHPSEAVEFRQKFCGMYRQNLEAEDVMQLCLLGVYGD